MRAGDITLRAKAALDNAGKIICRPSSGECLKNLEGYNYEAAPESIFKSSRNFDTLNKKLAAYVTDAAKTETVCYCVDGAVCEDEACKIILKKHKDCEVAESVSKASHAYDASRLSAREVTCVSAYSAATLKSCRAVLVYDIDCEYVAGVVKERLSYIFGEECECAFVRGGDIKKIKIYEIDRQKIYSAECSVAVQESEFLKKDRYDYADLEYMIKLLRAPGGCPWDRAQTSDSIKGNMIEEAYELADAIDRGDAYDMEEETGDVLLQAAFHSVLQEERGECNGGDALTRVIKKLIFRHSHIFGGDKAASENEALGVWENNKRKEKGQETFSDSVFAVPLNFPACLRAQKVQKRAAKCGMDYLSSVSASEGLADEVSELLNALADGKKEEIFDEAGDVLFSAVNVCRLAGVDCEEALRASTRKFAERFKKFEELIIADGKNVTELDGSQYDWYWLQAKNALKNS